MIHSPVFELGCDTVAKAATLSQSLTFLYERRTKINHPRHPVAKKYQMSHELGTHHPQ